MITVEIAAAVLIALSVVFPARGVVPRNRWLGIRTAATLRDAEAWQRAHRAALVPMCTTAAVMVVAGIVGCLLGQWNSEPLILAIAGAAMAGSLGSTWVAVRAVRRRLESDRPEPDGLEPELRVTQPPAARSPSR
ncbi:SdpI family protein [Curtobacterium sp. VKM Ac-2865]|uniref:SdpI family protein n=1 Tax=Curtobacterium sp. VKM Ac-2865 TaxID=2783817 RepID=UPI00188BECE4|nr:SdpI family protein [Curtobacterium sp. VKM Ac-2865]MBF4583229.1 SdpI family protein [Curtobacterium sp. VKM Ac-2865]